MTGTTQVVTLATAGQGAALELFQHLLTKALEDIADVNQRAEKARVITLKFSLVPKDELREEAEMKVDASIQLANTRTVVSTVYLSKHDGDLIATEFNPKQMTFDDIGQATEQLDRVTAAATEGSDGND